MTQDPIRAELPSVLTSQSGASKNASPSAEIDSAQASAQTSQTAPEATGLSQHPAAIRSRQYRQQMRAGKAGTKKSQHGKRPESQKPLWTAEQIRDKLRRWDRGPFMDLLGAWLECTPTPEALTAFSDRFPDRYAASLLAISKIAGFAERREVTAEFHGVIRVEDMSDSQLEDHLRELAYKVGIPMPKTLALTVEAEPAPPMSVPMSVPDPEKNPQEA